MTLYRLLIVLVMCLIFFPAQAEESKDYYLLSASKIARIIDAGHKEGQRRAVFIYASWCGYCRAVLPEVIELENQSKGSIVAISIDEDPEVFNRYIQRTYGELPFYPLVWDRDSGYLDQSLSRFGIKISNAIPFTAPARGNIHQ